MALSPKRITGGGETSYPWEREAIDFVLAELPDADPHLAWPLHELHDPGTGRLYEIDLLVLARSALFLIEIKSHPGVLTGDILDWTFTDDTGRKRHLACPYQVTYRKARILASLLERAMGSRRPFVQPLVFLSHETARVHLSMSQPPWLVTRKTVRRALVHGIGGGASRGVVIRPVQRDLKKALRSLGLRASKASRLVGEFQLIELLDDQDSYQEHLARHVTVAADVARVRVYPVPRKISPDRRDQLQRAAEREAQLLATIGRHPSILGYHGFVQESAFGPAVILDAFEGGRPLHLFLAQQQDLSFEDRVSIVQQLVEAVRHCHVNGLVLRNLSPMSVLVRRHQGVLEVRLHRFQTAQVSNHTSLGTRHAEDLMQRLDMLYQAPEVLRNPAASTFQSDVFSVGMLAWLTLTGQPLATSISNRHELLKRPGAPKISTVAPELRAIDEAMSFALELHADNRPDNPLEWWDAFILDKLTAPAQDPSLITDPYEAKPGEQLAHGIVVRRLIGSGATARVFKVSRGDQQFALKVPHDGGCERRLMDESRVIKPLRHPGIVQLHDVLTFKQPVRASADGPAQEQRQCLLLSYAGYEDRKATYNSLADLLQTEGSLSLDKALRFGDDLLLAVQFLEENGVTHRDIKPGNIGFTSSDKRARHLVLYDFSLSASSPDDIRSGTPDWRDPWLHLRGHWDSHADRFSSALVLYRMVAGTDTRLSPTEERVPVEAERFDAAVRDQLASFFERCFTEQVSERFQTTEEMRAAWTAALVKLPDANSESSRSLEEVLASATHSTYIESLPLSVQAKNALDRAGVTTVEHLLELPRNSLSTIRGVGRKVTEEIVEVASKLGARLSSHAGAPVFASYAGLNVELEHVDVNLPDALVNSLLDAGVNSTQQLADMSAQWLVRLTDERGPQVALDALKQLQDMYGEVGSLRSWAGDLLAPRKRKATQAERRVRMLVGLDSVGGKLSGQGQDGISDDEARCGATRTVEQVAKALDITPERIHASLGTMRQRWSELAEQGSSSVEGLQEAVRSVFRTLGPVCTMNEAVSELIRQRSAGDPDDMTQRCLAASLLRVATELRPAAAYLARTQRFAWFVQDAASVETLLELGAQADQISRQDPLASSDTVIARLSKLTSGTPLADVVPERLVHLAGLASESAAVSSRLELYPKGMSAERAVRLSLNVLTPPGLNPASVIERVQARYPDAEPLPNRPDLDPLLLTCGLVFSSKRGEFDRSSQRLEVSSLGTVLALSRSSSRSPSRPVRPVVSPEAYEAQEFQRRLDVGVQGGGFRVVQIPAEHIVQGTTLLARHLDVEPLSLDHAVWDAMKAIVHDKGANLDLVYETDRKGPTGEDWDILASLAQQATTRVIDDLLANRQHPRLVINPGILARFRLGTSLSSFTQQAQHADGAAIILAIPGQKDGLAPNVNGVPVPTEAGGQRLRMPASWISNKHHASSPPPANESRGAS